MMFSLASDRIFGKFKPSKGQTMYTTINFKTKKSLKEAVARGDKVTVFSPGPFPVKANGKVGLEGPHYPAPHRWHASAVVKDGVITKVS